MKKIIALSVLSFSFVLMGSGVVAMADGVGGGGEEVATHAMTSGVVDDGYSYEGYWIRGVDGVPGIGDVRSEYKQYDNSNMGYEGYASVTTGGGDTKNGGWQPANEYSIASLQSTVEGTNKANYNYDVPPHK